MRKKYARKYGKKSRNDEEEKGKMKKKIKIPALKDWEITNKYHNKINHYYGTISDCISG